jgi:trehalose 6-phosphate phosphatase
MTGATVADTVAPSKMPALFSEAGRARLDEIVRPGVLCMFDFDGTLAPIVDEPDRAGLPDEVKERMLALQSRAPVGILTGRGLDDINRRLGFSPDYLVGNHGLEGLPGWEARAQDFAAVCRNWHAQVITALSDPARFPPDMLVEDKLYSLSVHYRNVDDPEAVCARLEELFAALVPAPRVIGGKFVYNLLPQGAFDKGWALDELMAQSGAASVVYVGDDVTDEDVFRLTRKDLLSVRIGDSADSAAHFQVPGHGDILAVLDALIARLDGVAPRTPTGNAGNGGD